MIWTWLTALALCAWIGLAVGRGGFWRARPRLDGSADAAAPPEDWPDVTAVVPARNEAQTIGDTVRSLAAQDYPGAFRVVVVDDESSDGTASLARAAAGRNVVEVIASAPLARGWTGKLWALSLGIAHAEARWPGARYVWLTDADIVHNPDMLRGLVAEAEAKSLDLMSLMVLLRACTFWERLLIPPFVFFFQKLYPFAWVNAPERKTAAAAGGCMLLRHGALERIGGIAAIGNALIDDVALAKAVKPSGAIRLCLTTGSRSIRPYRRLAQIWAMVARTAFDQLGYSTFTLIGTVAAMVLVYLIPPLAALLAPMHGDGLAALLGAAGWAGMALAALPTNRLYGMPALAGLALPAAAALYVAMTVDSARRHWIGAGGAWKARTHAPERRNV